MSDARQTSEDPLDRSIRAAMAQPVPAEVRDRVLGAAIAFGRRRDDRHLLKRRPRPVRLAVAAFVILAAGAAAYLVTPAHRDRRTVMSFDNPSTVPDLSPEGGAQPRPASAQKWSPSIRAAVAEHATVLVANGGPAPIRLGSGVPLPEVGGHVHVWDWSRSPVSRIVLDAELWPSQNVALSPGGRHLVWAAGDVVDLDSGKRTKIDLGGADYRVGEHAIFQRIGDMRFSPDGGRLALLVTLRNDDATVREVVRVVAFPTGEPLCEFPAGEPYALRLAFSDDGSQLVVPDADLRIARRDVGTGKVLQRYEPALKSQVMALAVSPEGTRLAAAAREAGELLMWDSDSGRLIWRAADADPARPAEPSGFHTLRFSPDGKFLAAGHFGITIFDAGGGRVASRLRQSAARGVHWSGGGKVLTVITSVRLSEGDTGPREEVYPELHEWNWATAKRVASH